MDEYNWCLGIHDAIILCPEAANTANEEYCNGDVMSLKTIVNDRKEILKGFFKSLGLMNRKGAQEWAKVKEKLEDIGTVEAVSNLVMK